jgi:cyclin-A
MGSVSQRSERRIGCTKNHAGVRKRNATPVKTAQNTWRVRLSQVFFFQISCVSLQDIDSMHSDDPLMCSEYVDDIYTNLQKSEVVLYPLSDYIEKVQTDISSTMRGILVDWLVEVAEEYKLSDDTLFLSVLYLDRCLSIRTVARSRLQVKFHFFLSLLLF